MTPEEIPFSPSRVILQDFTGVPAVVDIAALRDAMVELGGDPEKVNPQVPVDLVIDHSVQVDVSGLFPDARENLEIDTKEIWSDMNSSNGVNKVWIISVQYHLAEELFTGESRMDCQRR